VKASWISSSERESETNWAGGDGAEAGRLRAEERRRREAYVQAIMTVMLLIRQTYRVTYET
jgi:hypothetical protein